MPLAPRDSILGSPVTSRSRVPTATRQTECLSFRKGAVLKGSSPLASTLNRRTGRPLTTAEPTKNVTGAHLVRSDVGCTSKLIKSDTSDRPVASFTRALDVQVPNDFDSRTPR